MNFYYGITLASNSVTVTLTTGSTWLRYTQKKKRKKNFRPVSVARPSQVIYFGIPGVIPIKQYFFTPFIHMKFHYIDENHSSAIVSCQFSL